MTTREPIRVLVVDDDPIVRDAIAAFARSSSALEVTGVAGDGAAAVQAVKDAPIDVAVMDVRMPVLDGIAATPLIREASPTTRVLLLTSFDTDEFVTTSLRAGASGFLLKDASPQALVEAIISVHEGTRVLSPATLDRLLELKPAPAAPPSDAGARHPELSARELEILQLLCRAYSNSEIAAQLHLSESTVKTHMTAIMTKLRVNSRLKAVVRAYDLGLVER